MTTAEQAVGDAEFVALTTFRRSGDPVTTTVWIVRDADRTLLVTTPTGAGKVKRVRHDPNVTLRPSSRRGRVAPDAPQLSGTAEIDDADDAHERSAPAFEAKYGWQFRLAMVTERLITRGHRRVLLRIQPDQG